MMTKLELKWQRNYEQLKQYITLHHHLPDKKKVENRGLLNWWKYNKKLVKQGKLDAERTALLQELSAMRDFS
ncbi:MAG: helicase associated domain-containing protein [Bacteroides sp.]